MITSKQITELAAQISTQIQWPEVMDLETAGRYMGRGPEAIRHFVRKRLIPRVGIDSKIQVRKADLDKLVEKSLY
jgi:hypothetical protein